MATAFSRTLHALKSDRGRGVSIAALMAAALVGGWVAWGSLASVAVYETTANARLEASLATSAIQSQVAGRVLESKLTVGRAVKAGDVLVQLDDRRLTLAVDEKRAAIGATEKEIVGLRSQATAESAARSEEQRVTVTAADGARANQRDAVAAAKAASMEADRIRQLRTSGLISEREYQQALTAHERSQAVADRETIVITRIDREQRAKDQERETRMRKLETEIARLQGESEKHVAEIATLRDEASRYAVRAPIDGRIGEAVILRPGSVIGTEKIAAIIPESQIQIVANYPAAAMGRIQVGQPARMRMEGYPWMQYGALEAVVTRVAGEVRDGGVRIELSVDGSHAPRIPLRHGLPGSLEIEVERVTPAALALRSAGRVLGQPQSKAAVR